MVSLVVIQKYIKVLFCKDWLKTLNMREEGSNIIILNSALVENFEEIL